MSRLLQLQIENIAKRVNNKYTLLEIVSLLEDSGINPKGNLTNASKKKILSQSLKDTADQLVENFINLLDKKCNSQKRIIEKKIEYDLRLHKDFRGTKVERFLNTGEYEEAVRVAFIRINNRVKKLLSLKLDGAALMRTAFSKQNPFIKVNKLISTEDFDEQEGVMHIFEGCMLAFRNPQSHDDEKSMSQQEAIIIINFANYLMGILDNVRHGVSS